MGYNVNNEMIEKASKFEQLKGVVMQDYPELQSKIDDIIKDLDGFLSDLSQRYAGRSIDETYDSIMAEIDTKAEALKTTFKGNDLAYVYFKHPQADIAKQAILYDIACQESELSEPLTRVGSNINHRGMGL